MAHVAKYIIGLAALGSAYMFPLVSFPSASSHCEDSSWHFLMGGPNNSTVEDSTTAKESFCGVVGTNMRLWNL